MKLRKLKFSLGKKGEYKPNRTEMEEESERERTKERIGAFHCWVPTIVHSAELDKDIPGICALVEEAETGKMYELDYDLIQFDVPCDWIER